MSISPKFGFLPLFLDYKSFGWVVTQMLDTALCESVCRELIRI